MSEVMNEVKVSRRRRGGIFPEGGTVLTAWVPKHLVRALITVSDGQHRSVSAVVRDLLVFALANQSSMSGVSGASSDNL